MLASGAGSRAQMGTVGSMGQCETNRNREGITTPSQNWLPPAQHVGRAQACDGWHTPPLQAVWMHCFCKLPQGRTDWLHAAHGNDLGQHICDKPELDGGSSGVCCVSASVQFMTTMDGMTSYPCISASFTCFTTQCAAQPQHFHMLSIPAPPNQAPCFPACS